MPSLILKDGALRHWGGANNFGSDMAGIVMYSISHVITQIAVPAFFLISGYLFFNGLELWEPNVWKRKIRSRINSLLVPYLLWVLIFSIIHLFRHELVGVPLSHWWSTSVDWINRQGGLFNLFWASNQWNATYNLFGQNMMMTGPIAFHLWFLRDLIVSVALSPVFFLLLGRKNSNEIKPLISMVMLTFLYVLQVQLPMQGFSFATFFFFGLGAYLSLGRKSLADFFYGFRWGYGIMACVMMVVLIPMDGVRTNLGNLLFPLWTIFGTISVMNMASCLLKREINTSVLTKYEDVSFFVYIIHPFFLGLVWTMMIMVFRHVFGVATLEDIGFANSHGAMLVILFLLKVMLSVGLCIVTYKMIRRVSPQTIKILCGR